MFSRALQQLNSYRRCNGVTLVLSISSLLFSCSHPTKITAQAAAAPDPFADPVPHSREANDAGRFLAGLPGTEGSSFAELQGKTAWEVHRRAMDRGWSTIQERTLPAMHQFQTTELDALPISNAVVFYPFSGPDALMLTVFFPRNPTYVMVGLEPPGTLPTPKQFAKKDLATALARERVTVDDELHRSFFITRQMDRQFRGQVTDGLLTPILQLLVRSGHTVLGHRYVRLTDDGQMVERVHGATGETGSKGVELEFQNDADQSVHKLVYLSVNLSDSHLRDNKPFLAFMTKLNGVASYFKATSYMTHKPEFSIIREQVLSRSSAILQDDSGIPYHFLRDQAWQIQLYGKYVRPYGSFRWLEQADLKKAYLTTDPKPLEFQIGYGFRKMPSNLLFAQKARVSLNRPPANGR